MSYPIKTVVLSSLHKVYTDTCPEERAISELSALKNEPLSFQVSYKTDDGQKYIAFSIAVESELPISLYSVDYVPILHSDVDYANCDHGPGLFPDTLRPKSPNPQIKQVLFGQQQIYFEQNEPNLQYALRDSWRSMWFTVNEDGEMVKPGEYDVRVKMLSRFSNNVIGESVIKVKIIDAALPKQEMFYTNWFHYDCLCDYYGIEPCSPKFWEVIEKHVGVAAKNGMNMILTPCFTFALDTPIGSERKTVQLVDVTVNNGKYSFGFANLKKFIDICKKVGIEYFEHYHLFTQWGAKAAPKIMGTKDGEYQQLFGWSTVASGDEYKEFLHAYIPALKEFLKAEGLEKKIFFHISDEPTEQNIEDYKKAVDTLGDLLDGDMCGDALSDYCFYEQGLVKTPIVDVIAVENFVGRCDNMWCYYTGGEPKENVSNRLVLTASERNRIIGVQMYMHDIKGFLHWGYNFYYDLLSHGFGDPKVNPGCYRWLPGAAYLAYPDSNGGCLPSIRQKVFHEGLIDVRALKTAEKLCGKEKVHSLVEKHFGKVTFYTCPESPEQLLKFREDLNLLIEKSI